MRTNKSITQKSLAFIASFSVMMTLVINIGCSDDDKENKHHRARAIGECQGCGPGPEAHNHIAEALGKLNIPFDAELSLGLYAPANIPVTNGYSGHVNIVGVMDIFSSDYSCPLQVGRYNLETINGGNFDGSLGTAQNIELRAHGHGLVIHLTIDYLWLMGAPGLKNRHNESFSFGVNGSVSILSVNGQQTYCPNNMFMNYL